MSISNGRNVLIGLLAASTLGLGCAHSGPPPRELVEARAAYARAESGPAQQLAPARMRLAKQALNSAELSYGGAPESEVRDRAYIAIRRVEAAEAEAEGDLARQRRERALRELASLSGVHAEKARAELAAAGIQVEQANQLAMTERQRADEEARRAQEANTNLDSERRARADAEARATQAISELERMANVRREARGLVITLSGQVLFVTDQATLLPAARTSLDSVAAALKGVTAETGKVVIEGHTDSTGARGYNLELSRKRAESVRNYLLSQGVPGDLLMIQGVGPDRPVASNRSPEGRANNRRVEIVIPSGAALAQQRSGADAAQPVESTVGRFRTGSSTSTSSTTTTGPGTGTMAPGAAGTTGTTSSSATTGTTTGTSTSPTATGPTSMPPAPSTVTPPPGTTSPPSPGTTSPPSPASVPPAPGSVTPPPTPGTSTPPPAPGTTPPPSPRPRSSTGTSTVTPAGSPPATGSTAPTTP